MDYKTEAFEAKRKKDAVIWIEAGFSILLKLSIKIQIFKYKSLSVTFN